MKFHLPSFPPVRPLQIQDNGEGLDPNGLGDPNPLGGQVPAVNQTTANEPEIQQTNSTILPRPAAQCSSISVSALGLVGYLPLKASISLKLVPKRWLSKVLFPGRGTEQPSATGSELNTNCLVLKQNKAKQNWLKRTKSAKQS